MLDREVISEARLIHRRHALKPVLSNQIIKRFQVQFEFLQQFGVYGPILVLLDFLCDTPPVFHQNSLEGWKERIVKRASSVERWCIERDLETAQLGIHLD